MKLTKLFVTTATFAAIVTLYAFSSQAASKTGTFTVQAAVVANCTIDTSTANIDFGSYDPLASTDYTANGTMTVACTKSAPNLRIALDGGLNYDGTNNLNQMASGTERLKYGLFQDTNHSSRWHNASRDITSAGKAGVVYTIYGMAVAGQDVAVGSYSDTVTATINF